MDRSGLGGVVSLMDKRFFLAVGLCVLIMVVWQQIDPFSPPPRQRDQGEQQNDFGRSTGGKSTGGKASKPISTNAGTPGTKTTDNSSKPSMGALEVHPHRSDLFLQSPTLSLQLSTLGATITKAILPKYIDDDMESSLVLFDPIRFRAIKPALTVHLDSLGANLNSRDWKVVSKSPQEILFELSLGDSRTLRKRIALAGRDQEYMVHVDLIFVGNFSDHRYSIYGPSRLRHDSMRGGNNYLLALADTQGNITEVERTVVSTIEGERLLDARPTAWNGIGGNYFSAVIRPTNGNLLERNTAIWGAPDGTPGATGDQLQDQPLRIGYERSAGSDSEHSYELFLGPNDRRVLEAYTDRGFGELVHYGTYLGSLVRLFLWLLGVFHSWLNSWGLAIIMLTFVVKLILHPINKRNQGMMQRQQKKMQAIQPQMDKLKEKLKNDPVRQQQELQALFRSEGVNPAAMLGGCLLLFLQMPVWIGLISTFDVAIELRQEGFLFIADLSQADRLFPFGFNVPLLGEYFNILPILYVVLTLVNQRMMPKGNTDKARQQQKMMTFMMVAFGFIFYSFSSGLLLYFMTSAALGIIEQRIIRAELRAEGLMD